MGAISLDRVARRLGATVVNRTPLLGGVSARVTALEIQRPDGAASRVVVREPGATASGSPAGPDVQREHDLLGFLHGAGFPVPRPLSIDDARVPAYFVMSFVEGTGDLPPQAPARMAEVLARLHALPASIAPFLPDREDPRAALSGDLGAQLPWMPAFLATQRAPSAADRTLLHGDYWPGNLIWQDGAIVAVLDWEDAAVGDPLSDVACCRLELRYVLGAAGADAFTAAYFARTGRSCEGLPVWDAYVALAALRAMDHWGLSAERLARMRAQAEATLASLEAPPPGP